MKLTIYRGSESRTIPAIDFSEAYVQQGWKLHPTVEADLKSEPEPQPVEDKTAPLSAIALINTAETAEQLEVLPSVGKVSAIAIFNNRPPYGYLSLDAVEDANPELRRVDWEAIALWEPE